MDILNEYHQATSEMSNHLSTGKKGRIVMLLGAGFSIDQGYPSASKVAEKLLSIDTELYYFTKGGRICSTKEEKTYEPHRVLDQCDVFQRVFNFLVDIIHQYSNDVGENNFNYEELYDSINLYLPGEKVFDILDDQYKAIGSKYTNDFLTYEQLVFRLPLVLDQIITNIIKEEGAESPFYKSVSSFISNFTNYSSFLNYLKMESQSSIIDVFTLNHDLFFESFKNISELQGLISDGFDDYGSDCYGMLYVDGYKYRCRLERYTGRYNAPIRLYKLHGSFDYVLFYRTKKTKRGLWAIPHKYVKLKDGIEPFDLCRSIGRKMRYEESMTAYCASFLSGTRSKIQHYQDVLFYGKVFKMFKNRLKLADKLIIIGYSGNDERINSYLLENLQKERTKVYIIDYKPGEALNQLQDKLNGEILEGKINEQIQRIK